MSGNILLHPPVAIDYWKLRGREHVEFYFLTHMHTDHTVGLTQSWRHPIYCSPTTRKLLLDQFQLSPSLVLGLEMNETHCLTFEGESDKTLSVTLLDANHCPGAVMFLFEGYFGRILYTGDFRYSSCLNYEMSFSLVYESVIDELHLDNTFCSSKCCFPSREKSMDEILGIITNHPDHRVMIALRKLGKESLLVTIAKCLQLRIYVSERRYHMLEILEMPNVFTTTESDARIHVVDQAEVTGGNMDFWNYAMPTIAIIPTALYSVLDLGQSLKGRSDVFVVSYSDHSSYGELHEFVSILAPRSVIPVVKNAKDRLSRVIPERMDMSCFEKYLDKSPRSLAYLSSHIKVKQSTINMKTGKLPRIVQRDYQYRNMITKGVVYEQSCEDDQVPSNSENQQNMSAEVDFVEEADEDNVLPKNKSVESGFKEQEDECNVLPTNKSIESGFKEETVKCSSLPKERKVCVVRPFTSAVGRPFTDAIFRSFINAVRVRRPFTDAIVRPFTDARPFTHRQKRLHDAVQSNIAALNNPQERERFFRQLEPLLTRDRRLRGFSNL